MNKLDSIDHETVKTHIELVYKKAKKKLATEQAAINEDKYLIKFDENMNVIQNDEAVQFKKILDYNDR